MNIFPILPGVDIAIHRQPEWQTSIKEAWSGVETTIAQRPWPRWRFSLQFEILRASVGEVAALAAFFNAQRGSFGTFLFQDPEYNSVSNQRFGMGDGNATLFQLNRAINTWLEPVWAVADTPVIMKDGVVLKQQMDYVVGTTGQVQFTAAPAAGSVLSWTGRYFIPVRFSDDKLDFERIFSGLWKTGKIEFVSKVYPT